MAGRWLTSCALICFGLACASAGFGVEPNTIASGQTIEQFQAAVKAELEARGDRMGFGLSPCPISPPFMQADETYIARAFEEGSTSPVVLIAVEDGTVQTWQEFELPGFEGWITHYSRACRGSYLEFSDGGELFFRYRWTGDAFVPAPLEE